MNERIKQLARQSGATDENGSRATGVFCFTEQELNGFAELLIQECCDMVNKHLQHRNNPNDCILVLDIKEKFGIES
jgi:hypothetical protein